MIRRGGYGQMMKGRFGLVVVEPKKTATRRLWIQAVSVGELLAIEGLVKQLSELPDVEVVLSTTTSTGYELAKQKYDKLVTAVVSFPLDFWLSIAIAWNRIQPDLCIITEAELWPEHIATAARRQIPLLLINARLSDKSYKRMTSASWLKSLFYQNITEIGASSEMDGERIQKLGYPADRISVTGNLKFDVGASAKLNDSDIIKLRAEIWGDDAAKSDLFTLIGASTWPGEEQILIEVAGKLRADGIPIRLLLTPRHAERRAEIRSVLEAFGDRLNWAFRSKPEWSNHSSNPDALSVFVADTTGELKNLLQLADIAVIGRSFPPHTEGQTPIEAAALGIPVVYGPSLSNFRSICRSLEKAKGSVRVESVDELPAVLRSLLQDSEKRNALREAAVKVFEDSKGSTDRTRDMILRHF